MIHVNAITFLVTASRYIHYHTATAMKEMTTYIMVDTMQQLVSFYPKCKFRVKEIFTDGQFRSSWTALADLQINLNCISMDEYVPEAERLVWTLKERCRCSLPNTLFPKLPKKMVVRLLQNITFCLNTSTHSNGINDLSPLTIVQGGND